MKIKNFRHFLIAVPTLLLSVSVINFAPQFIDEVNTNPHSEDVLILPASVTPVDPYSYTDSPTNEPWYYTTHNFKNTETGSDGVYYSFNQKDTTYSRMNTISTWNSYRGEGVRVAVIDTGLYESHEDFNKTNISSKSKNFYSTTSTYIDGHGHGTSSASTIAASINGLGGSGIAPNIELLVLKCSSDTGAFSNAAINNALQYCIDNDVDIINMSIQSYGSTFSSSYVEDFGNVNKSVSWTGSGASTATFGTKINACYAAGITIVAAAGNYNTSTKSYPAANDHVISVASTGLLEANKLNKAGYSNYGDWVDICAPGYITTPTLSSSSSYSITYGTSFSSPLVTGAIALYKSKFPTATPDQIESALKSSATALSWSGSGAGQINVEKFLEISPDKVYVESVTLSEHEKTIKVGDTYQLSPTVLPVNADNKNVLYESSDEDIATVDNNGLVTALKAGDVIIEASSEENSTISDMVEITIEPSSKSETKSFSYTLWSGGTSGSGSSISATNSPITITLSKGYKASSDVRNYTNGSITVSGSNIKITSFVISTTGSSYSGGTLSKTKGDGSLNKNNTGGNYTIVYSGGTTSEVSFTNGSQLRFTNFEVTYEVVVTPKTLSSITVSNNYRLFNVGDTFIKEIVTAHYSDSTTEEVTDSSSFSGYDMSQVGEQTVSVSYTENSETKSTTYTITVNPVTPTVQSLSVTSNHRTFTVGDLFIKETVTAHYIDGSTLDVTNDATFSGYNTGVIGTQTVSVSYGGKSTTYDITVNAAPVTNYTVSFNANGGTGTMDDQTTIGSTYETPSCLFTRAGYTFSKWALGSASGTEYDVGSTITGISSDITLFAKWVSEGPTEIDDDYGNYYSSILDSYSGSTLLNALNTLNTEKRSKTMGYDGLKTYGKYTEQDWTGVASQTGKMLGFYDNAYIADFWDNQLTWNREHVWPNSRGGGTVESDMHMVRPTSVSLNSERGSMFYGIESGTYDAGKYEENFRGMAARIIFYCAIANPTLSLVDLTSDDAANKTMGKLSTLLKWNLDYAPSRLSTAPLTLRVEQNRNREIYKNSNLQGNRNPFIDHPEYACRIWGNTNEATKAVCGAAPSKELSKIEVSGTLAKTNYEIGENFNPAGLTVTATYDDESTLDVTNSVTWTPSSFTSTSETSVTGSYTYGGTTKTVTVTGITVSEPSEHQYKLEADSNSVPYMSGTNHVASVNLSLYYFDGGVKGEKVTSGTDSVDTSSLGNKEVSLTYKNKVYYATTKVSNNGAEEYVGTGQAITTETKIYTFGNSSGSFSGGISGTTCSADGTGFESSSPSRGIQWSKKAGTTTINKGTSSLDKYNIKSIYVTCSSNGENPSPTMSVSVGTTSFASSQTISKTNNQTLIFTNSVGLSDSSITISTTAGSKSTWIKSITLTYEIGKSYPATPTDQAKAWANYFINITRTSDVCLAPTDQAKLAGLKSVWADLKAEYGYMISDSKTEFCLNVDEKIVEARLHYQYIITKYSGELDPFVVDGDNNPLDINDKGSMLSIVGDYSTVVISVVSVISVCVIGLYAFIKRRKVN